MGHLALDASTDILALDTPVFIYFLEKHPIYFPVVKELFTRIEEGQFQAAASSLIFTELLVPGYRQEMQEQVQEVFRLLTNFPNLRFINISPAVAREASRLRACYKLRTPDALHVASAIEAQAKAIVTNDFDFQVVSSEIKVLLIDHWIEPWPCG